MIVYPTDGRLKRIVDTIFLYQPTDDTLTMIDCDGEKTLTVLIERDCEKTTLSIELTDDDVVITNTGIIFNTIENFVKNFWAIDWVSLQ